MMLTKKRLLSTLSAFVSLFNKIIKGMLKKIKGTRLIDLSYFKYLFIGGGGCSSSYSVHLCPILVMGSTRFCNTSLAQASDGI